jgi:transcriptional regulator
MRHNPKHAVTDETVVRRLIEENPWATIVSPGDDGLVASHYPMLLDDEADDLTVVTHVGRPDERIHGLGSAEVLLIFAGPHGYVSPSWYAPGAVRAPTWNFSVAHCHGTPEILELEENIGVLTRLVARFEQRVEEPLYLERETAAKLAPGTVGLRIPIDRFVCKVKMSQDKDPRTRAQVLEQLSGEGPYSHPELAEEMKRALTEGAAAASD